MATLLVGTRKGLFIAASNGAGWTVEGPSCEAWPINHAIAGPDGTVWAGGGNEWFGPAVWRRTADGWSHSSAGIAYAEGQEPVKSVWSLARGPDGTLWTGVEPAGLFRSEDDGETWSHVEGLSRHPSRPHWQPGGGGLILHHILVHPADPAEL